MFYFYNKITNLICSVDSLHNLPDEEKEGIIQISEEQYNEYFSKLKSGYNIDILWNDSNIVFDYILDKEKVNNNLKRKLRIKRKPLLEAFDKYKTNVNYGIEIEDKNTRETIINWYQNILDLEESAFTNVPLRISYYL